MVHHRFALLMIASLIAAPSLAAPCSITPPAGATDAQLTKLATLSKAEAEKIALAKVKSHATAKIASAELEAEDSCLVWSFDIRTDGKSGIQEVVIDAGDGHIISSTHEGPRKEAAEKAAEAIEAKP